MKYLIFNHPSVPNFVVIFGGAVSHEEMASCIPGEPVSAGKVGFNEDGPYCHGRSITLNLSSREGDTALVRRRFSR